MSPITDEWGGVLVEEQQPEPVRDEWGGVLVDPAPMQSTSPTLPEVDEWGGTLVVDPTDQQISDSTNLAAPMMVADMGKPTTRKPDAIDDDAWIHRMREQSDRTLNARIGEMGASLSPYIVSIGDGASTPLPEVAKPGDVFVAVGADDQDLAGASFWERTADGARPVKKADFVARVSQNSLFQQNRGLNSLGDAFPSQDTGGEGLSRLASAKNAAAQSAARVMGDTIAGAGTLDSMLYRNLNEPTLAQLGEQRQVIGKSFSDAAADAFPQNPEFSGEFWADKFASAAGSALPFAATGSLGTFLGPASSSLIGALSQAQSEYETAISKGASPEQAKNAALVGIIGGASEGVLGIGRTGVRGAGGSILRSGVEEQLQETFQGWLSGLNKVVNMPREEYSSREQMNEIADVMEQGAIAFMLGSGMGAPGAVAQRMRERAERKAAVEAATVRLENAEMPITAQVLRGMDADTDIKLAESSRHQESALQREAQDQQSENRPVTITAPPVEAAQVSAEEVAMLPPDETTLAAALAPDAANASQVPAAPVATTVPVSAPTTYEAISNERVARGDDVVAREAGITATEVQDFMLGSNKTGVNPGGYGQDGLTLEIQKRRLARQGSPAQPEIAASIPSETEQGAMASAPEASPARFDSTTGTTTQAGTSQAIEGSRSENEEATSFGVSGKPPTAAPVVTPRIQVEPITGGNAKSPYQIISDFSANIGKAIRVRRLGRKFLGMYQPGSTVTTERFAGDLDTAAHELAGHWLDDKNGLGKPWHRANARSPYDAELAKFWPHGSVTTSGPRSTLRYKRAEGIAEFTRAYIVNPAAAKAAAPSFSTYFERNVPADELQAIQQFSTDARTWAGEDPVRRASLNVRMEGPSLKERLWEGLRGKGYGFQITPVDRLRMWFEDPYWGAVKAYRYAKELRGKTVKPSEDFELLSRLLSTHDSRLSDQLEHGLVPFRPKQAPNAQGKLELERINDPVTGEPVTLKWLLGSFDTANRQAMLTDMREASGVMVAERTLERARQIDAEAAAEIANTTDPKKIAAIRTAAEARKSRLSGLGAGMMSDVTAAQQTLAALAAAPSRETKLKEAARRYRLWADQNIQMLVESGRLSKADAAKIRDANEFYVDMHRLSDEFEAEGRAQRGGSIGTTRDVVKRFKGSTLEIDNVYKNLLEQTDSIQKEAHRNVVMLKFTEMLTELRGMHQGDPKDLDAIGSIASNEDRNTLKVFKDGKVQHWKFEPAVRDSLKGLGELGTHLFIDLFSIPSRVMRYLITLSPDFMARNFVRDTAHRSVVGTPGSKPWDILRGYSREDVSRYEVFGGGQFGNYTRDRSTWNRELKKAIKEMAKDPSSIVLNPVKLVRGLEAIGEASEKLGRIAEFRRAFEHGQKEFGHDDYEAALYAAGEARGLIDFAKAGTVMRAINKLIPFSNAKMQGLAKSVRAAKTDPAGFAMRWGLWILLPTMLTRAWNSMDDETWEEYQQMPEYLKDFFWNFKVGNYWLRIPRPHELGVMASGVERGLNFAAGDEHAIEGWDGSIIGAMLPFPMPTEERGVAELMGPSKIPVELALNRDTFRGRDIIPYWERDLKLSLREGQQYASGAGQRLGSILSFAGLKADARQVDHVLNSYGGLGKMVTSFTDDRRRPLDNLLKATGYVVEPPSVAARDVQWVMDWAKANGVDRSSGLKEFKELRKAALESKTAEERDARARKLRRMATRMRKKVERTGGL